MTSEILHEKILQERGFDIHGKHVSTGTLYDKNGFDKNGFDITGFHIDTETTWNIFGYDRKGHKFGVPPKTLECTSTKTSQVITDDDRQAQYDDDWDRDNGVDYDDDDDDDDWDGNWAYGELENMVNCVSTTYESEAETGFN